MDDTIPFLQPGPFGRAARLELADDNGQIGLQAQGFFDKARVQLILVQTGKLQGMHTPLPGSFGEQFSRFARHGLVNQTHAQILPGLDRFVIDRQHALAREHARTGRQ